MNKLLTIQDVVVFWDFRENGFGGIWGRFWGDLLNFKEVLGCLRMEIERMEGGVLGLKKSGFVLN